MEEDLFVDYIIKIRNNKMITAKHYLDSLNKISKVMVEIGYEFDSIYDIDSFSQLLQLKDDLKKNVAFKKLDEKGHRMYSAGLNRYIEFSEGKLLDESDNLLTLLDEPCPVKPKSFRSETESERRDRIIVNQVLQAAHYQCEIDSDHKTFKSKTNHHSYMEAHHLIPLNMQKEVSNSLDVYSNLICLCPTCHMLLHHGMKEDKSKIIENLYDERKYRMQDAGLKFGKHEFNELIEESGVY